MVVAVEVEVEVVVVMEVEGSLEEEEEEEEVETELPGVSAEAGEMISRSRDEKSHSMACLMQFPHEGRTSSHWTANKSVERIQREREREGERGRERGGVSRYNWTELHGMHIIFGETVL